MRITYVITRSDVVGGAQVHVRDLAHALHRQGHDVTVLIGGNGPVISELEQRGVSCRRIPNLVRPIHPVKDVLAFSEITRALSELKPHLVSTHTAKAGILGRLACGLLRIPSVFTPHGWSIRTGRFAISQVYMFAWAERLAALFSKQIVNVAEYERHLALRSAIAPARKLCVVHNGVQDVPETLRANPGRGVPRIVMVARMEEGKDHTALLEALALLKDLDWHLDLIGDGPLSGRIQQLATQLGLHNRISFLGCCKWNVAAQLSNSQLFVLTSKWEAFPRSILEAMRAGLPVIATDVGGVGEAVIEGQTGFLVPMANGQVLRDRLARLITDSALRNITGRAGRKRYETHFTFELMLAKTLDVYRSVLADSDVMSHGDVDALTLRHVA